ncbi:MAG: methyltransferase [Alphaproteobacteria bacterium]|jgi:ubiquinone/menaquinone biosynthesis C-methylase UbiE|nr:MAG: methyltransferase [Alphaproteobacteria bacterium]
MGLYQDHVLPLLIHLSMRQRNLAAYRARVVPAAQGRVLEIGIGSGLNLPYYGTAVEQIIGLDSSPKLLAMARKAARQTVIPLELIENSAEAIPLYNRSIDTIVTTWTMCSIPDVQRALGEMRRILKPGGRLLFVEHGRSQDVRVRRWQDRLTPVWCRIGGGCHLNRAISELIEDAGFGIEQLETGYMRGPKPMTFMYEGVARPR